MFLLFWGELLGAISRCIIYWRAVSEFLILSNRVIRTCAKNNANPPFANINNLAILWEILQKDAKNPDIICTVILEF